jgi:hypothetical protein
VLGGVLVNTSVMASLGSLPFLDTLVLHSALYPSLVALLLIYGLASVLNLGIPHSGVNYPASTLNPIALMKDFWRANRLLWRDAEGGLSLAVTTIFWGLGATLQFVVLKWSADVLGLPLEHAAYLQAAVAVGVVAGAGIAGRWIALRNAKRVLPAGVLMGLLIMASAHATQLSTALIVLSVMGAVGGILVVPLNALLQHRGFVLLTAGRSIAVQGFNENLSVLCMLGIYAGLVAADFSIISLMTLYGLCTAVALGLLIRRARP